MSIFIKFIDLFINITNIQYVYIVRCINEKNRIDIIYLKRYYI